MNFSEHTDQHVRLTILRFLLEAPGYTANASTLKTVCQAFALVVSGDQIRTNIGWLADQRLVTRTVQDDMVIATLTERGGDVAEGRARVDGVARPGLRMPGGSGTAG